MSLSIALQNALSGLQANEAILQVISNNVTNANTEGYTRKDAATVSRIVATEGRGVRVSDISREVDERLLSDLRGNLGTLGEARTRDFYYRRVLDQFGTLANDASLGASITDLSTAFQTLAASPESIAHRSQVITAAVALAKQLNDMSAQIQALRFDADKEIATKIEVVNEELEKIADLNSKIEASQALGEETGELEDSRDQSINKIAELIDIRYFKRTTGEMVVTLPDGHVLADQRARPLSHTPAGALSADISYPEDGIAGIMSGGTDITASINAGEIKGLIDARDTILPNLQAEIDKLTQMLRDEINTLHNAGAGRPPADTLTGTRNFADPATDTVTTTAGVRIAVVADDGTYVSYYDLAAGTYTVDQIRDLINTNLGSDATASTSTDGPLTISANDSANGIAIVDLDDQTVTHTDGTATYSGFSNYFGLNDFFVTPNRVQGDSVTGLAGLVRVRSDIVSNPARLSRGALDSSATPAPGDLAIALGDASIVQAMADKFVQDLSFVATGDLPLVNTTLASYAAEILSTNAVSASAAEKSAKFHESLAEALSYRNQSVSGVNVDEELRNMVLYENAYAATARVVKVVDDLFEMLINLAA